MTPDAPPAGRLDGREHRFPVRVYFEDTDPSGVVYHANFLRYMERARTEFLRSVGIDHRAGFTAGEGVYAVAEARLRYLRPAQLDEALVVVSRVAGVGAASIVIHQRVMRGAVKLVDAELTAAYLTPEGRPRRQPRAWIATFEALIGE